MSKEIRDLVDAATATGLAADERRAAVASLPLPEAMRACVLRKEDASMFDGVAHENKDPRKSLHVDEIPVPEPGVNECLIAPMAAALNYNTVWSTLFEPRSTFTYLERFARLDPSLARHNLPYQVVGSDAAGIVLRTGPGVTRWRPGDRVTVHPVVVDLDSAEGYDDAMLDPGLRAWGFETNFGALAEVSLVKANQLMPMPNHLTWEEAAGLTLTLSTSYRMLVSPRGGGMKQGDVVLIWGASGGLGGFAVQLVLRGGGIPVCVVSSPTKARRLRELGVERVIDRVAEGYEFWSGGQQQFPEWRRFGRRVRELTGGDDVDIVFEHIGRETFGASIYVARRGGTVVTCASTSGYRHEYDNRVLWMNLKRVVGSHGANYREAWEANRLVNLGMIHPIVTRVYEFEDAGQAALDMHLNTHTGKLGVLVNAPRRGLGVLDGAMRARHADAIAAWSDLG
jgi:crotonyl-CoA reductase